MKHFLRWVAFLLQLAARNLLRHRLRNALTSLVMVICCAGYIYLDSMLAWAGQASIENLVRLDTGLVQIMRQSQWQNRKLLSLDNTFDLSPELESFLEQNSWLYAPRVEFAATLLVPLSNILPDQQAEGSDTGIARASITTKLIALDPEKDATVYSLRNGLTAKGGSGQWFSDASFPTNGLLLGKWLAKDTGLSLGDTLWLSSRDTWGSSITQEMTVAGILSSEDPLINANGAFMQMKDADWLLDLQGENGASKVSFLALQRLQQTGSGASYPRHDLALRREVVKLQGQLDTQFPQVSTQASPDRQLKALSWEDLAQILLNSMTGRATGKTLFLLMFIFIAVAGITNSIAMAILERKKEMATMRAFGMGAASLRWLLILENLLLGLFSGLLGLALAVSANWTLVHWGLDFSRLVGDRLQDVDIGYRLGELLFHGVWRWGLLLSLPLITALLAVLATLVPSRHVLKINLREALHES